MFFRHVATHWRHLPQHIQRRWTANAKAGVFLHLMNNQTQIRASRALGVHWPLTQWTSYSLLQAGQRLAAKRIAHRLRTHCVPDEEAHDLGRTLSYDLDDSEIWRVLALTMQDQHAPSIPAHISLARDPPATAPPPNIAGPPAASTTSPAPTPKTSWPTAPRSGHPSASASASASASRCSATWPRASALPIANPQPNSPPPPNSSTTSSGIPTKPP